MRNIFGISPKPKKHYETILIVKKKTIPTTVINKCREAKSF